MFSSLSHGWHDVMMINEGLDISGHDKSTIHFLADVASFPRAQVLPGSTIREH